MNKAKYYTYTPLPPEASIPIIDHSPGMQTTGSSDRLVQNLSDRLDAIQTMLTRIDEVVTQTLHPRSNTVAVVRRRDLRMYKRVTSILVLIVVIGAGVMMVTSRRLGDVIVQPKAKNMTQQ